LGPFKLSRTHLRRPDLFSFGGNSPASAKRRLCRRTGSGPSFAKDAFGFDASRRGRIGFI